ncbi:MAG: hypothetical protein NXI10_16700 [bacterium]|nr:hypothetical protein [bacterium]
MLDSLEIATREELINDTGPYYHEFHPDATVMEPWNAFSSLVFFIPVIYWIIRLRGEYRQHLIIVAILPLLFMNGLGSTLYHAFRNSQFFLYLDWVPASVTTFVLASYFWTQVLRKWYWGILTVFGINLLGMFVVQLFRNAPNFEQFAPNIGYFIVGCSIFTPILIQLIKYKFKYAYLIGLSALFLSLSLLFRTLDYPTPNPFPWLPQGTHFLWHIFSSFAVFSMGYYLYYVKLLKIKAQKTQEVEAESNA